MSAIKLIVGLGNPGPEHEDDRHNVGFWFVDALARQQSTSLRRESRFFGDIARVRIAGTEVWLLEPMTYMNRSGQSVGAFCRFYRIAPAEVLVAYDELDLQPGIVRTKSGGSSTHNGLRDITSTLGGPAYWRLRFGIGHPREHNPGKPVADYVLGSPSRAHRDAIEQAIDRALDVTALMVEGNWSRATSVLHTEE